MSGTTQTPTIPSGSVEKVVNEGRIGGAATGTPSVVPNVVDVPGVSPSEGQKMIPNPVATPMKAY